MTRLLLLEDHTLVLDALRLLLATEPDFEVVAVATTLREALSVDATPDVILADLMLPDARGPDVVAAVRGRFPAIPILVVSVLQDGDVVRESFAAGARGYVPKVAGAARLVQGIRVLARGDEYYLAPEVGGALLGLDADPAGRASPLTRREVEVVRRVALGETNKQIAASLHLSLRTVETHRANVYRKLGVRTRAELVRYAREHGLL